MLRSGLIVEVAAAGPATGSWRRQLDPQALLGVPPHVTVLYPFVPPDQLDTAILAELQALFSTIPPFDFELTQIGWFGDQNVLWLAPEPVEPFQHITTTLVAAFPDYPPYGGQFDGLTPHLTVGTQGTSSQFRRAEDELRQRLPIHAIADTVTLMTELPGGRWERNYVFALAEVR